MTVRRKYIQREANDPSRPPLFSHHTGFCLRISRDSCVLVALCVSLCSCVCEGSNYANAGWHPSEAQCRYGHPVTRMCLCIYTRTHFIPPNDLWPCGCTTRSVLERQVQRTDDKRPNNDCHCGRSCSVLSVCGEDPEPRVWKILKYWMKRKERCQTLYLSCLRSLFVCLIACFMNPFLSSRCFPLIIGHSLFWRKEVSLSFRCRRLTSEAWGVLNECNEFQLLHQPWD